MSGAGDVVLPGEAEVAEYFHTLSNWGRWGPDDELGTLNLITADVRRAACHSVQEGLAIGCARLIDAAERAPDIMRPPIHYLYRTGESSSSIGSADFFGTATHGVTMTHIDALSHRFWSGRMYNDRPQSLVTAEHGAAACSVDAMRDGIVTRGVLLDIPALTGRPYLDPGEPIHVRDLEAAESMQGVRVESGDALLVRTGWSQRRQECGPHAGNWRDRPGLHAGCLPWLHERGVAVLAADAANDVVPSGYGIDSPIHMIGLPALGLCVLDNLQFEDLLAACRPRERWSFLFTVAPLRLRGGTGSPATPVVVL